MGTRSDAPGSSAWERPLAVLFDLDGTLYDQRPLRKAMLWELGLAPVVKGPMRAIRIAKVLRAFRIRREELRSLGSSADSLAELQYSSVAADLNLDAADVCSIVDEWIMTKPLKHLGAAIRPGVSASLSVLREAGVRVGVFSDYPPAEKLAALGIADLVEVSFSAIDVQVNAFKPDPAGFIHGAEALGAAPSDVVYVGDRPEMDGLGAQNAGMRSVILDTGMRHVGESRGGASVELDPSLSRTIRSFGEVPHAVGIS